jgi:predicted transcriptional regulator
VEKIPTPTPRELEILKVLWELGPCTVRAVHQHLSAKEDVAYNTIQTMLRLMERDKGQVSARLDGRTFVYTARFSRDEYAARFLDNVFDGAAAELVQSLLRTESIPRGELDQLQAMIDAARRNTPRPPEQEGGK